MKKIILSTIVLMAMVNTLQAQSFALGVKGGANLTKIAGQSFQEGYKLGYQIGAFAELDITKKFGIQPELLYSQTSSRTVSGASAIYVNLSNNKDVNLNYLSIPILLRINASKLVTIHVGPQYSILVNHSENTLTNGKEAFKNGDFSAVAGLQINLKMLRIYGRYNIGLSNVNDIDNKDQWKSQQIQLGVGLRF